MSGEAKFGLNVQMHFLLKATNESASDLQSVVSKNIGKPGVEFHCRALIQKPEEIQEFIKKRLVNKSFGNNASYFCDINIKPDLLTGLQTPLKSLSIQLGTFPINYLYINMSSGQVEINTNGENILEKVGYIENLFVKLSNEIGLFSFLEKKRFISWVSWRIKTDSKILLDRKSVREGLKKITANTLFPIQEADTELEEDDIQKYVSKNGRVVYVFPKFCLSYVTNFESPPLYRWRFLILVPQQKVANDFFANFNISFRSSLIHSITVLQKAKEQAVINGKIRDLEMSLDEIMEKMSKDKLPVVFENVNHFESKIWQVSKENSLFLEDLEYLSDVITNEEIVADLKKGFEKMSSENGALFEEIASILTYAIRNVKSGSELITKRCTRINEEFNSLKSALTTRIQIGLEKRNLSIQNGLAFLQVVAVVVLLFELLRYFYSFEYDWVHITLYALILVLPFAFGYIIYKRLESKTMG